MFLKLLVTSTLFLISLANAATDPYQSKISTLQFKLKSKNDKIAELQEKLDGCSKGVRGAYVCSGWNAFASTADVLDWQKELASYKKEAETIHSDLKVAMANKDINTTAKIELAGRAIDANMLLLDVKSAQSALKTANIDIQALKLKFDQSLLGEYTKYAIENSMKSANGQKLICGAVSMCSDSKKSKSLMDDMEKKVKSFEEFRKAQLELLKRSELQEQAPAKPPQTFNGGGISI